MAKYKSVTQEFSIQDALGEHTSIGDLAEEMESWGSNMEGTGLEHTQKYESVSEAAETLRQGADDLEQACGDLENLPQEVLARKLKVSAMIVTSKKKSPSRAVRLSNTTSILRSAVDEVREWLESLEKKPESEEGKAQEENAEQDPEGDPSEEDRQGWQEALESLESALDEVEGVEFPGMFG